MLGLAFRPDGKQACACAIDGTLKFWDLVTEAAHPPAALRIPMERLYVTAA